MKTSTLELLANQAEYRNNLRANKDVIISFAKEIDLMGPINTTWSWLDCVIYAANCVLPYNYGLDERETLRVLGL